MQVWFNTPMGRRRVTMVAALAAAVALHVALLEWTFHSIRSGVFGQARVHAEGRVLNVRTAVADQLPQSIAQFSAPTSDGLASPTTRLLHHERNSSSAMAAARESTEYAEPDTLTARAAPIDDIPIPAPEVAGRHGSFKAKLVLYIEEDGTVMRIDVQESNLPAELEAVARGAFATAHFHPGMIEQRAVKSKLRIEVGFETESAQP